MFAETSKFDLRQISPCLTTLLWTFDCNPVTLIMYNQVAAYSWQQIPHVLSNVILSTLLDVGVSKSDREVRWAGRTRVHQM